MAFDFTVTWQFFAKKTIVSSLRIKLHVPGANLTTPEFTTTTLRL
jgi:hypothetical protein